MAKAIIGIIGRRETITNKIRSQGNIILYEYINSLLKEDASCIGLITNDQYQLIDNDILDLCDGILMMGGVEIKTYHIAIIKYALEHSIPYLGICLGAQALALSTLTGAKLLEFDEAAINKHFPPINTKQELQNIKHLVTLAKDSLLYNILGEKIGVNSNHKRAIPRVDYPLKVVGMSEDGYIEAIEYVDNKQFAVGVQWHPESMESMQPIFKEFVSRCKKRGNK